MDLRRARTFVAVADLGTVSKAAEHLHVAQPALSRQIGTFEQELGFKLFDRVGSRLVLTGEGEQLLGACRRLLDQAHALADHAQTLRRGDAGVLRVAASPQFIEGVLADFLHAYAARFAGVQVKLHESIDWSETVGLLERGEIHLGQNLLRAVGAEDDRLGIRALEAIELLAVGPPDGPLGADADIEIADLCDHPLLVLDGSFVSRRTFDSACRLAGVEPNIVFESRTLHTLLAMAERGHGVALMPSAVRIDRYALRASRVTQQGRPLREPLAIFWDKRRPRPHYTAAFCEMLAEEVRRVFPITRPLGRPHDVP